jgi:hypothetical protein
VWEPSTETGKTRCAIATIIDNATGESYAHGEGDSDELALRGAIEAANTMPKPMTKAQKNSPQFLELQQTVKDQAKRIADLEASMRVKPTPPLDSVESGAEPNPPAALTRGQRAAQTRAANAAKRVAEQAA